MPVLPVLLNLLRWSSWKLSRFAWAERCTVREHLVKEIEVHDMIKSSFCLISYLFSSYNDVSYYSVLWIKTDQIIRIDKGTIPVKNLQTYGLTLNFTQQTQHPQALKLLKQLNCLVCNRTWNTMSNVKNLSGASAYRAVTRPSLFSVISQLSFSERCQF